ncbi:MAG: TonB-dependent receptor [Bacteroidota bacterium]
MAGAPITGLVIAEDSGEPVVGANVAVYQNDRFLTGAATDLDGRFSVSLRPGTYRVRVSFVGYDYVQQEDVAVRAGSETDLGTITLSPNAALLGEAQVVAEREFIEQQADRTVYNVQEQAVTAGGNALETLQTLPGLEVDTDGNVSLRGNQNVAIQINGRPVPVSGAFLAALLRQIPADRVDAVEVIPNPSARYEPDGMGGIINIRLAEGTDRGLSGGLTFGGGTQPNANIGANVSYQQGAWDLNAQYGFRFDENVTVSGSDLVLRDANGDIVTDRRQDGDSGNESTSHFLNGSATYSFFEGADLTFEGSLGLRDGLNENATQFEFFEGASDVLQRLSDAEQDGFNGDAALVFRRKFVGGGAAAQRSGGGGRPGGGFRGRGFGGPRGGGGTSTDHELAIETRYTFNQNDNLGCFADLGGIGSTGESGECYDLLSGGVLGLQRQDQDQTNAEASLQVDYTRPLGAAKLEIGARLSDERVTSDQVFSTDRPDPRGPRLDDFVVVTGQTNAFEYDRQIAAAYVQAARPIGPFQVQAGVRAEYAQRSFDLLTEAPDVPGLPPVADAPTELDYTNLFPSFFLTYPIGEGTLLKGSYSRRIDRPRTSALNPFPSFEDTTFVRVGNPGLTPEYTDSFELGFTYRYFLTVTPFYRRQTDALSRFVFTDPVTGNRAFTTVNFDTEESYGTEVTLLAQFGPVRGFVNTTVAQEVISGESDQESAEGLTWRASTSVQARLREGTNLQFFFFYRGPSNIVGGQREGFGFSSLGINQTISDRLSLSARVNDVFSTSRFEFETTTFGPNGQPNSEVASFFDPAIQAISATLTWTFGSGPQRQQRPDQQGGNDGGGFGDL